MNIRLIIENLGTKSHTEIYPNGCELRLISDVENESIMVTERNDGGDTLVILSCRYEDGEFFGRLGEDETEDELMFAEELSEYLDLFDLDTSALQVSVGE
jgi:hypothetical protein